MAEKRVAESFAGTRAARQAGNIDEADGRREDAPRVDDLPQHVKTRIGHRNLPNVRLDRRKRIVRRKRLRRTRERIEDRRLAHIRKAYDSAREWHGRTRRFVQAARKSAGSVG